MTRSDTIGIRELRGGKRPFSDLEKIFFLFFVFWDHCASFYHFCRPHLYLFAPSAAIRSFLPSSPAYFVSIRPPAPTAHLQNRHFAILPLYHSATLPFFLFFLFATSNVDSRILNNGPQPDGSDGKIHLPCAEPLWVTYRLPPGAQEEACGYVLTSANDCPERDPHTWSGTPFPSPPTPRPMREYADVIMLMSAR